MTAAHRQSPATWFGLAIILTGSLGCHGQQAENQRSLTVLAASSLTDAFSDLGQKFEQENPDRKLSLTFAGSQVLRLQIAQGAPAQVFASANKNHMETLVRAGLIVQSRCFADNQLALVVPRHNPAGIKSFSDLTRAHRLVLGSPNVPVGIYTRELLRRAAARYGQRFTAAVEARVVSRESNVRLVRAKVELGEADAAIVYATDAAASSRVRTVPIPPALNLRAGYFIGLVERFAHTDLGRRWIDHVLSDTGQQILVRHGFVATQ